MLDKIKNFHQKFDLKWDKEKTIENLLDLKKILEELNCDFYPGFGTFLGMYRNNDIIDWDYDSDIIVIGNDYQTIEDNFAKFAIKGFDVVRHDPMILSFRRNKNYTDIYPFYFKDGIYRSPNGTYTFYPFHIQIEKTMECFGTTWKIFDYPEIYLSERYGDDWMTPKEGEAAKK